MSWRLERTREELAEYGIAMKDSWQKRSSWRDAAHLYVDIFKEAFEHMPYTLGHIAAIYVVVVAFLAIGDRLA